MGLIEKIDNMLKEDEKNRSPNGLVRRNLPDYKKGSAAKTAKKSSQISAAQKKKRKRKGSVSSVPQSKGKMTHEEKALKLEEQLISARRRRNVLEETILSLTGGKTGMSIIWNEIIESASAGDDVGFLFFSGSFPKRAEELKKYFDELMKIIEKYSSDKYQKNSRFSKNETVRYLALPYRYEKECRELLNNSLFLAESNLLGRKEISRKELLEWYAGYKEQNISGGGKDAKE